MAAPRTLIQVLFLLVILYDVDVLTSPATAAAPLAIGVNYGAFSDNLPPPSQVAAFLRNQTSIDRVKLFDANPDMIRAFAGTGISLAVTAPNGLIPSFAARASSAAADWVSANISPFVPATNITMLFAGNEIMATGDRNLIAHLVPAMRALRAALDAAGLKSVRVSTPHHLGILASSEPPSTGRFRRGYDRAVFTPVLQFHRDTKSPFVVNPYPYFGYNDETLNYALFRPNSGIYDVATKVNYTNMFTAQLDAVYWAMKKLGYGDVEIAVGETGWPTAAEPGQKGVSPAAAEEFNTNVIGLVNSGKGTPMMPRRRFETYLFALFNEDLKPGPIAERNWGIFRADFTPVYDAGIMKSGGAAAVPGGGRMWCVAKLGVDTTALQSNINYACSNAGVDCSAIQPGGACYDPNNLQSHASFAMNAYYQNTARHDYDCDFAKTGVTTTTDPSYGSCKYSFGS